MGQHRRWSSWTTCCSTPSSGARTARGRYGGPTSSRPRERAAAGSSASPRQGYGKSTLLAEWAQAEDGRVAWVALDRYDDDPASLLTLLASTYTRTLRRCRPGGRMRGLGVSVLARRATPRVGVRGEHRAVRPHAGRPARASDAGLPRRTGARDLGIPRDSQLVAASRFEQPHLPRLRASGDALEFGTMTWPSTQPAPRDLLPRDVR